MQLADIVKAVGKMTDEELAESIRTIRGSRLTPKTTTKKAKKERKDSGAKVDKVAKALESLSPEVLEALLATVGGKK